MSFTQNMAFIAGLFFISASSQALAETIVKSTTPLSLRVIMQDLNKEMKNITTAISLEDWTQVKTSSAWIAAHPRPPLTEKKRIKAFLGDDMATFKAHDIKTHKAAQALADAAMAKDGQAVIAEFSKLQNSCLSCHQRFRSPIQKLFHGQP